jgi:hypothetical protein
LASFQFASRQFCGGQVEREGPEGEGGGEDVGVGEGALGVPDGVDGGEQGDSEGRDVAEQPLGEAEDGQQAGRGEGTDREAGDEDVESEGVPERAQDDAGQRCVGVGKVRDEGAGMVEVQRGGDVVATFVPEVGQVEQGEMAERDGGEECCIEYGAGQVGEACELETEWAQGS